jgi:anti-sigma B factor antagonist
MLDTVAVRTGNPVIAFSGEIDMSTVEAMSSGLQPLTEAGGPLTVDLSKVSFMDSSGIHALFMAAAALGDRGCIILHGVDGSVDKVLRITGADSVPNIHVVGCSVLDPAA